MTEKIQLKSTHPETGRVQAFLNMIHLEKPLVAQVFEWKKLAQAKHIKEGFKFISNSNEGPVIITVLLCDSYNNINPIALANKWASTEQAKWGHNGCIAYYAESQDPDQVNFVVQTFAGEE
ncbi:MAG: hypothetical protein JSS93_13260 [Bacteroidetes bacterium]|nr:hypothetical protein [Bacteroidota bacterium]